VRWSLIIRRGRKAKPAKKQAKPKARRRTRKPAPKHPAPAKGHTTGKARTVPKPKPRTQAA
jgi:hypothetical protein